MLHRPRRRISGRLADVPGPNDAGERAGCSSTRKPFDTLVFGTAPGSPNRSGTRSLARVPRSDRDREAERAFERLSRRRKRLHLDSPPTLEQALAAIWIYRQLAFVALYEGDHDEAAAWLRSLGAVPDPGVPPEVRANMTALLGINALRRGEQDNCIGCVGPSSCIFPIAAEAVHTRPSGSREAVRVVHRVSRRVARRPAHPLAAEHRRHDAGRVSGEGPAAVPDPGRAVPLEARPGPVRERRDRTSASSPEGPTWPAAASSTTSPATAAPTSSRPRSTSPMAPRCTSTAATARSRTARQAAGLDDQVYALNVTRADYDNDGRLDVLLLRGALGEAGPDVAVAEQGGRGLRGRDGRQRAGRADRDRVGRLGRLRQRRPARPVRLRRVPAAGPTPNPADPSSDRARPAEPLPALSQPGRRHVRRRRRRRPASRTSGGRRGRPGATTTTTAGSTCSSRTWKAPPGSTTTRATARSSTSPPSWASTGRRTASPACSGTTTTTAGSTSSSRDYSSNLAEVVADYLGLPVHSDDHAHLYHNLGTAGFREVSREAGLARPMPVMSVNAGDIDNDGDLDLHLGTGWMSLSGLVPDLMYANVGGRFEDVTESTGTGHLQKGHGVSFADWDDDGDLDLFVVLGGGYPGDRGYNALFQNPGHGRSLAEGQARRHQDQPVGHRRQAPGRPDGPRRQRPLDPPRDRQQRQLRRQHPRRVDRPARREVRRPPDRHLADQQDDPDLPRPGRRPVARDHRRLEYAPCHLTADAHPTDHGSAPDR